jgi:hypothetical protein
MLISWKLCGLWQTVHLSFPLPLFLVFSLSTCEADSFLPLELLSSANAAAAVQNENPTATMKRGTNAPVRPLAEGPPLVEILHNFFIKTLFVDEQPVSYRLFVSVNRNPFQRWSVKLHRNGAVGFIEWLGFVVSHFRAVCPQ